MGPEAGHAFSSVIKKNHTLVRMDLSVNRMGPVVWWRNRFKREFVPGAGESIGEALRVNKHLTDLDLSQNDITGAQFVITLPIMNKGEV